MLKLLDGVIIKFSFTLKSIISTSRDKIDCSLSILDSFAHASEALFSGKIKVEIYKKYKLDEVETAHKDLEGRKIIGPAIIIP